MGIPRIEVEALLKDEQFLAAANRMQVQMDRLDTLSQKTGLSKAALTKALTAESAAVKSSTMSWTDFRSMYSTVVDVLKVGQQVFNQTVGEAQAYDQQIRDVMLTTGATAEESSRLVQVVDDAGVSYGVLKTAMKMASKEGIEPNIASLQALSDQYLQLAPGVERNQFLLDKFGKSGLEMARVMELGGAALGKMNAEIDGGLVLTQEAIDASEEYRKNVDALSDSWQSFKVTLGNNVIPVLNDVMEGMINQNEIRERANELLKEGIAGNREEALTLAATSIKIEEYTQGLDSAGVSYRAMAEALGQEVTPAMEDNTVAIEDITKASRDYLSSIEDMTSSLNDQSAKLDEIKEKYGEGSQEYADATAEFEDNTHRRMLAMLEEQLSIGGLEEKESAFLLEQGVKWGIYSEEAISAMAAIQRQVDAMERNIDININVHTNYSTAGQAALSEQIMGEKGYTPTRGNATGGSYTIPMSYGNEGFRMSGGDTASGGEQLTITPKGKSGNEDVIAAIERNRLSEERLAQLFEGVMLRVSR